MVLVIFALLIMVYSLKSLKRGFCLYLMFLIVGMFEAPFITLGGKSLSIGFFMSLFFCALYCTKIKDKTRFPFFKPFLAIVLSLFITCFYAVAGFVPESLRALDIIFREIITVWLAWKILDDERDLFFLIKGMTFVFCLVCLYGFFEYITQSNPIVEYKSGLLEGGITLYSSTTEAATRGYRLISFMEHPIGAGMTMGLFVIFVMVSRNYFDQKYPRNYVFFSYIVSFLCVMCAILTKMRASLVFIFIGCLSIINIKKKRFYLTFFILVVCALLALPLYSKYLNLILWMFNENAASRLGGSSIEQRIGQLEACLKLMEMSPIGGLGERFKYYIRNAYTVAALGYESIWFEQMVKHGLVGVATNLYLAFFSIITIPRRYKSKPAFYLSLSYWVVYTLTCVPAFRTPLYYVLLFYFIKKTEAYKTERNQLLYKDRSV